MINEKSKRLYEINSCAQYLYLKWYLKVKLFLQSIFLVILYKIHTIKMVLFATLTIYIFMKNDFYSLF